MKLTFHTNLDEAKLDVRDLNYKVRDYLVDHVPREGDRIVFRFEKPDGPLGFERSFTYELEMCAVNWNYHDCVIAVELHIPSYYSSMSLNDYCEWFKRHRGQ